MTIQKKPVCLSLWNDKFAEFNLHQHFGLDLDCEGIYLTFDLSAVAKVNRATPAPAAATTVTEAPVESASANKEAAAQAEEEQAPASAATDADDEKPAEQAEK